jgi:hypothetical protein
LLDVDSNAIQFLLPGSDLAGLGGAHSGVCFSGLDLDPVVPYLVIRDMRGPYMVQNLLWCVFRQF